MNTVLAVYMCMGQVANYNFRVVTVVRRSCVESLQHVDPCWETKNMFSWDWTMFMM